MKCFCIVQCNRDDVMFIGGEMMPILAFSGLFSEYANALKHGRPTGLVKFSLSNCTPSKSHVIVICSKFKSRQSLLQQLCCCHAPTCWHTPIEQPYNCFSVWEIAQFHTKHAMS